MIFAAGLGTRLKPLTDTMPKALVRVGGEPLIKRVIMNLAAAGVDRIVVNVHHFAGQIIDYLKDNDNFGLDIRISDETAGLLETGGGIKKAAPLFDHTDPILIHNVDILSNVDLREFYQVASRSEKGKVKSEESNSKLHHLNPSTPQPIMPQSGIIIMNCNPFTLGHRYLIEQAAQQVQTLYILVVREDCSMFGYDERKAMIVRGVAHINNVVVCDGSEYSISATTFPTYFLKSLSDASDTQMTLDIDLYRRHIAPALGATVRFVGTEPDDPLTRRYNELMKSMLPDVREVARLQQSGVAVSASRVRKAIVENHLALAARLVPPTTVPYIVAHLATRALKAELNTTPKPGLVDTHDSGAHRDMDHALMMRSIRAMHPYFVRLATLGYDSPKLPAHDDIVSIGLEAEKAMFKSTGGVNTYKGALFSMGLALTAATYIIGRGKVATTTHGKEYVPGDLLSAIIIQLANGFPDTRGTHGSQAKQAAQAGGSLKSALDNAREGYSQLFGEWLPFYETRIKGDDSYVKHKTLLRIMCDLDDTNIVYRTDYDTMLNVKTLARHLLEDFSEAGIDDLNRDFVSRNISPGGSADMLALVVFLFGITRKD